ncbi:hypothetical protein BN1002_04377 [Bacillus sp. B-jedd]|nr:hypothetical protein BN1002_04377 [Bacillus sp. B-jedd]
MEGQLVQVCGELFGRVHHSFNGQGMTWATGLSFTRVLSFLFLRNVPVTPPNFVDNNLT